MKPVCLNQNLYTFREIGAEIAGSAEIAAGTCSVM